MKRITVQLAERSYPLIIGARLEDLGRFLARRWSARKALIVTNPVVRRHYAARLSAGLAGAGFSVTLAVIPDGEQHKTLENIRAIYGRAVAAGLDRRSPIIALGGGVVGDMAGFAAATYMRGVPYVQVPTTLLAMVDSSVGGKTGVDLPEGKNLVGSFYQPDAVWMDLSTLETLPRRHLRNGFAEVIKYGVILDEGFFRLLEKTLRSRDIERLPASVMERVIARCCELKARVVGEDEFEQKGVREVLNFGHTFGHALETLTGYRAYLHGEAIAVGMRMASAFAERLGLFSSGDYGRLTALIERAGLPTLPSGKLKAGDVLRVMFRDKKVREGKLRLVLPRTLGKVEVRSDSDPALVKSVLGEFFRSPKGDRT